MEKQTTEEGEEEKDEKSFSGSFPRVTRAPAGTCYLHRYVHASTSENRLLGGMRVSFTDRMIGTPTPAN